MTNITSIITTNVPSVGDAFKDIILRYMDKFDGAVEKTVDFAVAETPIVINEYLQWGFYSNVAAIAFILFLVIVSVVSTFLLIRKYKDPNFDEDSFIAVAWTITSIVAVIASLIISFAIIPVSTMNCIKIKVAPRVYLIEKAMEMSKNHGR